MHFKNFETVSSEKIKIFIKKNDSNNIFGFNLLVLAFFYRIVKRIFRIRFFQYIHLKSHHCVRYWTLKHLSLDFGLINGYISRFYLILVTMIPFSNLIPNNFVNSIRKTIHQNKFNCFHINWLFCILSHL